MNYKRLRVPKCATLANRIRDDVAVIVKELNEREDTEATDEERFNLLAKLLGGLYAEFSALSKTARCFNKCI